MGSVPNVQNTVMVFRFGGLYGLNETRHATTSFLYAIKAHFRLAGPKNLSKFQARLQLASVAPMTGLFNLALRKHLRTKVTTYFHLTYSKYLGNLGSG